MLLNSDGLYWSMNRAFTVLICQSEEEECVIPAQAGIQCVENEIPAFVGILINA
jgi:hypothetical protein